jgi:hypothetical protein
MHGIVETVLPKTRKDGSIAYSIVIDGQEYWDAKGIFKDKKGQDVEYEFKASDDGKFKFINAPGGTKGGGFKGKSPEELKQSMKLMILSYAKDLTTVAIQKDVCPCEPTAILKFTKAIADGYIAWVKADD